MCGVVEGLAVASLVLGAASAKMQHDAGKDAANAQNAAAARAADNANQSARNSYEAIFERQRQERDASVQKEDQVRRDAREASSTAIAAGASAGTTGISVDALLRDFAGTALNDVTNIRANQEASDRQTQRDIEGVRANAEARIISNPTVAGPSGMGLALGIGQSVIGAASMYDKMSPDGIGGLFNTKKPAGNKGFDNYGLSKSGSNYG